MKAYFYDDLPGDQRLPHDSAEYLTSETLTRLGLIAGHYAELDAVNEIAKERSYKNRDEIIVSPDAMGDIYESKVKMFFNEHLHEDEEIRYVLDGSGYFDVRSDLPETDERWVRVHVEKGDLIILPAGIYHRFTTDENNVSSDMQDGVELSCRRIEGFLEN